MFVSRCNKSATGRVDKGLILTLTNKIRSLRLPVETIQELFDIVYGAINYLPDTKITIGIAIGLVLLIYFRRTLGGLVTSILLTILVANSYFVEVDLYQVSAERAVAGIILGLVAFFVNLYFLVRTLADWRD
jgi:hypothetical protein